MGQTCYCPLCSRHQSIFRNRRERLTISSENNAYFRFAEIMRPAGVSPYSNRLVISSEKMIVFLVGLKARALPAQQQAPHYFLEKMIVVLFRRNNE